MTKSNEVLQHDVQAAIEWEPILKDTEIGVTVKDGIVTLLGTVDSYAKKLDAETVATKVAGVKAVVEKITVELGSMATLSDSEIASEISKAYTYTWEIPVDKVHVAVEHGWVTLTGEVAWNYQKVAARKVVRALAGVKGVTDSLRIHTNLHEALEKMDIERALDRNWSTNDATIDVAVSGNRVTLSGSVDSIYQKDEAGRVAWNAPGVRAVDNNLIVDFSYELAI